MGGETDERGEMMLTHGINSWIAEVYQKFDFNKLKLGSAYQKAAPGVIYKIMAVLLCDERLT